MTRLAEVAALRRTDREVTSRGEIDEIIRGSQVCRLALAMDDSPYLVPVCFGYDGSSIFFHTAKVGRKVGYFETNNKVCFEFERNVELVRNERNFCKWSLSYESVIGYGTISELVDPKQKVHGMDQIALQYSGKRWPVEDAALSMTRLWRISVESLTGKRTDPR